MSSELALHAWISGQLLEPEHFERQERVLLAHMAARLRLTGLPAYGVAALELDREALAERKIVIRRLDWLLQDGRFVSTEGNVERITPLELEGRGKIDVYMDLVSIEQSLANVEASRIVPRRYQIRLVEGEPAWGESVHADSRREEWMKLFTLEPEASGRGVRLGKYVPPLMHVSTTPFLRDELLALYDGIEDVGASLQEGLSENAASGVRDPELRRRWLQGRKLRAFLAENMAVHEAIGVDGVGLRTHPYWLFCALRDYACEVAVGEELEVDPETMRYDHDDLWGTFASVLSPLSRSEVPPRRRAAAGRELSREGRLFVARDLPEEAVAEGTELLLKITGRVDPNELVLASPLRIRALHLSLLKGLVLRPVPHLSDESREVRYYRLECSGEEWGHVRRERALCFQRVSGAKDQRAELLWTKRRHGVA